MIVVIGLELLIVVMAVLMRYYSSYGGYIKRHEKDYSNNLMYYISVAVPLILLWGLRGDFTEDYKNYVGVFHYIGEQSLVDILLNTNNNHTELLYNVLNKLVYNLTGSEIVFFLVLGVIMIVLFVKTIKVDSPMIWLSFFLFVSTGHYFISFNLIRVVLAGIITLWGSKFIYNNNIRKYILIVLIASLIHKSALCTLIVPIFAYIKWSTKMKALICAMIPVICAAIYLGIQPIVRFVSGFIYTKYSEEGAYGIGNGLRITSMAVPVLFTIIIYFLRHDINYEDKREKVWLGSFIVYFMICVATLRVEMMQWLSFYFCGYTFLFLPELLKKQPVYKRKRYCALILAIFTVYSLASSFSEWQYKFFWQ